MQLNEIAFYIAQRGFLGYSLLSKNKQEDNETIQARADFNAKVDLMTDRYVLHRRKAKVVFCKSEVIYKATWFNRCIF